MRVRKVAYGVHRWLGLVVSVQLLAWSVGGLTFSVLELEAVRGERDSVGPVMVGLKAGAIGVGAAEALRAVEAAGLVGEGEAVSVALVDRGLGAHYEVRVADGRAAARVDAATGEVVERVTEEEARRAAVADFGPEAGVARVVLLEEVPGEARGRALPLWRVELDHASGMRMYVDGVTGEVVARRNRMWRAFDFFWMLHIMDYDAREDFNHPLLTVFAALAVATSASGLGLWWWRGVRWVRRRRLRRARG